MFTDRSKNWGSYIIPAILFPLLSLLTIFKTIDTDLWFHMKAGEVITETGRFIYKDIFSYTAAGRDWLYHEWLFGVLSYKVYATLGVNGLILGKASILTLAFVLLYRDMRLRGVNPYLASFILTIAVLAARFRFTERPHIFKFLFVAAFIYILDLYRLKRKNRLWILPFIQLIWTNMHGSFILGPAIISIYLLHEFLSGKKREIKGLSTITLLSYIATLINPYGLKLILFSLGFREKAVLATIMEWAPTQLKDLYGAFGLLFVAGIASFVPKYKKLEIADLALFVLFSYLSIKAIRFTALFSLAASPILAGNLQYLFAKAKPVRKWTVGVFSLIVIAILFTFEVKRDSIRVFGLGQGEGFPQKAVKFIKQHPIKGNMYNPYRFGGYLIWGLYPERKVFIDGRAEVFDKEFQKAFINSFSLNKWFEAINRYDINYAVIGHSSVAMVLDPIGDWISIDPDWVLIYWDEVAKVYVRDLPRNQDVIKRYGHKVMVNPVEFNYNSLKKALNKGLGEELEVEFKRDIESDHENSKVLYWLGMLYNETGRREDAVKAWEESVRIIPDAGLYSSIGTVFAEKGVSTKAIEYYKKAIETDKRFAAAYYNLGNAYNATGNKREASAAYKKFLKYAGPEYADRIKELKKRLPEGGS
ncbi:MAG: tetratricopeptide repeat protein [Deltaproteobacteria bacterium]|nr:tetratricopeptide repeat protein [Deltaproteobacteria bacterium]